MKVTSEVIINISLNKKESATFVDLLKSLNSNYEMNDEEEKLVSDLLAEIDK